MITRPEVEKILADNKISLGSVPMVLVGVRGYGELKNRVGVFDDAMAWIDADSFHAFNANTDPSREYPHVANLKPGAWHYKQGTHHGSFPHPIPAYVEAASVTVMRYVDGKRWNPDTGIFGIHIHPNHGNDSTSSIGCQTLHAEDWHSFKAIGDALLAKHHQPTFLYLLIDAHA